MKKLKQILSFTLILTILFSLSISNVSAATVYGNSNSNIKNGGIALKYNGYYYSVSGMPNYNYKHNDWDEDSAPGWTLYSYDIYAKKSPSGKIISTIADNALEAPFLNSQNGYIYYIGLSPNTGEPGVYRIKTDGTNMKRLASITAMSYRGSPSTNLPIIIKDNYIYYCSNCYTVKRMNLNGTNKKTIYKSPTWIDTVSISGSYLYINNITNQSYFPDTKYSVYRVSTNGKSKKCIYASSNYIWDACYSNGYIFYRRYSNGYDYLYRMNSNGSNKKCLIKTTSNIDYCIYNSKVYYTLNRDLSDESERTSLRTCSLSGTNKRILFTDYNFYIRNITGGVVYFEVFNGIGTYNLSTGRLDLPCV